MVYFSERELGPQPRTREDIPANVWQGIVAAIQSRIRDGSFGREFPGQCPDGIGVAGTNEYLMTQAILAQFPQLHWPPDDQNPPQQYEVLDLIEFCHAHVAMPRHIGDYHEWYGHYDLVFNVPAGKEEFRNVVNQIFARNGLAYDLQENGEIVRLAPYALREGLAVALFQTGDPQLDRLLEISRHRFLDPDPGVRMDGLEKLWDAWERLKTIEHPADKKDSITKLLDRAAAEPSFRQTIELEARALTEIGNKYMIRHTEVGKIPIQTVEQMDYFFHRMFALISLLLRATGRGG
jgi:AbiJ-like protein